MPQSKPGLLLYTHEKSITQQLSKSQLISQFDALTLGPHENWVDAIQKASINLAIIQADFLSDEDLQSLISNKVLSTKDLIFISEGEPNPVIDRAMHRGASYHLRLPLDLNYLDELLTEIYNELLESDASSEPATSSALDQFGLLVGSSKVMRKLYRLVRKTAETDASVLIVGESGSGKELVANTIHLMSPQSDRPFIALNCGALSPELIESELFGHVKGAFTGANKDRAGVFEQAEGGTLFLDEVTEMPLDHQVKLLRVLETGEYRPVGSDTPKQANVRIVSATNRDPLEAIEENIFREDVYFRLAHFPIQVPPLRKRGKDIEGLAKHFLAYRNAEQNITKEISLEALEKITEHSWPGNVRELKHTIERAYILADDIITTSHLIFQGGQPEQPTATLPTGIPLEEVEKGVILKTLDQNDGNKTVTAEQLGVSVKTLYNKLEKYDSVDDLES